MVALTTIATKLAWQPQFPAVQIIFPCSAAVCTALPTICSDCTNDCNLIRLMFVEMPIGNVDI